MKNKEIIRVQNVIESDRLNVGKGFSDLFIEDIIKLVKDYFDLESLPSLNILKDRQGYKIEISFFVSRIKPFKRVGD